MSQLLVLFAALSMFTQHTLDQVKKIKPPVTTAPKKSLTPVQLAQQKNRIEFVREKLAEHEDALDQLRQRLVDGDNTSVLEKDAAKLLKTYTDFNDIKDLAFDNKAETIQKLNDSLVETRQLLKDIKAPKRTVEPVEAAPTVGTVPPPPPPPPAPIYNPAFNKPKTGIDILAPAAPAPTKTKQPAKPAGIDISGITDVKLKKRADIKPQINSFEDFKNRFDALQTNPQSAPTSFEKKRAQVILQDLAEHLGQPLILDRARKEQLLKDMTKKFS